MTTSFSINILCLLTLLVAPPSYAKKTKHLVRVAYYKNIFGHIHQNPSKYSTSKSTISCGHPVKIFKTKIDNKNEQFYFNRFWNLVKVGPYWGYIHKRHLSKKRPSCFQDRYPQFFNDLNLNLSEFYYWGKLYDHYTQGIAKVK